MIQDPVTLSGGDHGGDVVEGQGWPEGEERELDHGIYRRVGAQAVFLGPAPQVA